MSGHTHTHTHTHTYTHDNYDNPRCAHAHRGLIIIRSIYMEYVMQEVDFCLSLDRVHTV